MMKKNLSSLCLLGVTILVNSCSHQDSPRISSSNNGRITQQGIISTLPQSSYCNLEGLSCTVNSKKVIAFGADGLYNFAVTDKTIKCTTDVFGDPAPRKLKSCYIVNIEIPKIQKNLIFCGFSNATCNIINNSYHIAYIREDNYVKTYLVNKNFDCLKYTALSPKRYCFYEKDDIDTMTSPNNLYNTYNDYLSSSAENWNIVKDTDNYKIIDENVKAFSSYATDGKDIGILFSLNKGKGDEITFLLYRKEDSLWIKNLVNKKSILLAQDYKAVDNYSNVQNQEIVSKFESIFLPENFSSISSVKPQALILPGSNTEICTITPEPVGCKEKYDAYLKARLQVLSNLGIYTAGTNGASYINLSPRVALTAPVATVGRNTAGAILITMLGDVTVSPYLPGNDRSNSFILSAVDRYGEFDACLASHKLCLDEINSLNVTPTNGTTILVGQYFTADVLVNSKNSSYLKTNLAVDKGELWDRNYTSGNGPQISAPANIAQNYRYLCRTVEQITSNFSANGIHDDGSSAGSASTLTTFTCIDKPDLNLTATVKYLPHAKAVDNQQNPCKFPDIFYTGLITVAVEGKDPYGTGWIMDQVSASVNGGSKTEKGGGPLNLSVDANTGDYIVNGSLALSKNGLSDKVEKSIPIHVQVPPNEPGGNLPGCLPPPPPCPFCYGPGGPGGDPHIQTFDRGAEYDFQGVGEFILARTSDRKYEVQIRMKPAGSEASVNSAAAMMVNGDRVGVYALGATAGNAGAGLLNVNGQDIPFSLAQNSTIPLPQGGRVVVQALGERTAFLYVYWPDGSKAVFGIHPEIVGFLNLYIAPELKGKLEGLLGNADGDPGNDRRGRDGTSYPLNLAYPDLYTKFGLSWRVPQSESLFQYAAGQDTNTFTDLNFPPAPKPIPPEIASQAKATCQAAGIVDPKTLNDCAFDVAVTQGQPVSQTLVQAAVQADPAKPSIHLVPTNQALAVGQSTTIYPEVNAAVSVNDLQWSTTAGTLVKNSNGSVTITAPANAGDMIVTAAGSGTSASLHLPVSTSALQPATSNVSVYAGYSTGVSVNFLGDPTGKTLNWSANRGHVSSNGLTTATYTAPAGAGDDTITVKVDGSPNDSVTIPVAVMAPQLSLNPTQSTVRAGDVIGFTYTGAGFDTTTATVNWTASGGTLATGPGAARYTAPSQPGNYTVTASLAGQPNVQATANITVMNANMTVLPSTATVQPGETQNFSAQWTGVLNPPAPNWTTSGGTLKANGMATDFTAPKQAGTYTVTATSGDNQSSATVTVPALQPNLQVPWPADQAVAFPGMKFDLSGTGLLAQRAVWTITSGTLVPNNGGSGATLTTPDQPGDLTVSYGHSLFPDVQATTKLTVQAPNISLVTSKDQFSVGEVINAEVKGVPDYLCSRLKVNVGQLSGCVVKWIPAVDGSQAITVSLDDAAHTTVSKTVQIGSLKLVTTGDGKVHAGTPLSFQVQNSFGQPYAGPVTWEVSGNGGTVDGYLAGSGGATFHAGNTPGTYTLTAHADGGSAVATTTVQVYLDPIMLVAPNETLSRSGDEFTIRAVHATNQPYPVPLNWQATGATLVSASGSKATFKTTALNGPITVTANVPGQADISAQTQLTVVDLAPTLTLADGTPFDGKQILAGQRLNVQARTSNGTPFTQQLDWSRSSVAATNLDATGKASFATPINSLMQEAYLVGCLNRNSNICSTMRVKINSIQHEQTVKFNKGQIEGVLVGEHLKYSLSGESDLKQPVMYYQDSQLKSSYLPFNVDVTGNRKEDNAFFIHFEDNPQGSSDIGYYRFEQPQLTMYKYDIPQTYLSAKRSGKMTTQSMAYIITHYVLPGQELNIQALLPDYTAIPALNWITQTGSFTSNTGAMAVYRAPLEAGVEDEINVAVQGTQVDNAWYRPLHFQVVEPGIYLTTVNTDPTDKIIQLPFKENEGRKNLSEGPYTFGTVIVGYPGDKIVWDDIVGIKTELGDGTFTLASNGNNTPVHLSAHLLNHPDVKLVFDGYFYQIQ